VKLGPYELLSKLGQGGMAEVWLARQRGLMGFEKMVAVKRLLPHLSGDRHFVRMFLDEARIAARINHGNVVQIFDLGEESGTFFIAMEYLAGLSLARVMGEGLRRQRPLPEPLAASIVSQMCNGLHCAHTLANAEGVPYGIVHRDVSPQNVVVLYDGGVKLVDFGIAKARERLSTTTTRGLKGKLAYFSPEQCLGEELDHRTDIFAAGVVLWEVLARRRLFKHTSELMVLKLITEGRVAPPSRVNPAVPARLDEITLKALDRDRNARFPSALEMSTAIDEFLAESDVVTTTQALSRYMGDSLGGARSPTGISPHTGLAPSTGFTPSKGGGGFLPEVPTAPPQDAEYWLDVLPEAAETVVSLTGPPSPPEALPVAVEGQPRVAVGWRTAARWALALVVLAGAFVLVFKVARPGTRLSVESSPTGANVRLDGRLLDGVTPIVVPLASGTHRVDLVLGGYAVWGREVVLLDGETLRIEAVLRKHDPPRTTPSPVSHVESGPGPLRLAEAKGVAPSHRTGNTRSAEPRGRSGPGGAPPRSPRRQPTPPPATDTPRPAEKEFGYLTLATTPWATIYYKQQPLGDSPLIQVRLPVGVLHLEAVGGEGRIRKRIDVEIRKGEVTRKSVALQ
jgi:eukaryotic-like serine/threonine-protein kinase